jgi:hypothetical protein
MTHQTPAEAPEGPQEPRTGPGRQPDHPDAAQAATEQLRADANTWRLKAIRRALTASRLRGTIDACIDLADEPVTDRTAWGDGYRAGIADLREVLREFGHLEPREPPAPDGGPSVAEATVDDRVWPLQKAGE